jgi:hypothetical protein
MKIQMNRSKLALVLLTISTVVQGGNGEGRSSFRGDFDADKPLPVEIVVNTDNFPSPPELANLRPFFVSVESTNSYYIDQSTLALGDDEIVRYVLVIETAGGVRNVTRDFFCTNGGVIRSTEEAKKALGRGKHPDAN